MLAPTADDRLARAFWRGGWIGFWMQVVVGVICIGLFGYSIVSDRGATFGTRSQLTLLNYMTMVSLVILAFTTLWSCRYIFLSRRIAVPDRRPKAAKVRQAVGIGVAASAIGLVLSMLIMLFEVTQLFIYFLRVPKAGVPVIQTTDGPASWISAGDILNLTVVVFTTFIEVLVLVIGLWLLFRMSVSSTEYPHPHDAD